MRRRNEVIFPQCGPRLLLRGTSFPRRGARVIFIVFEVVVPARSAGFRGAATLRFGELCPVRLGMVTMASSFYSKIVGPPSGL